MKDLRYNIDTNKRQPDTAERGTIMKNYEVKEIIETGKEMTGVTIREYRTYNNGDKVMIRHHYFYNADEIIDNYHATDPSYICKYKGLMFGKDDNDYYVSEFHYEEQYL